MKLLSLLISTYDSPLLYTLWKKKSLRTYDVIITSTLRHNDIVTSFWRNYVIITPCIRWEQLSSRVGMMTTSSSLVAPQVAVMTTCGAASDDKVATMTTIRSNACVVNITTIRFSVCLVIMTTIGFNVRLINITTIRCVCDGYGNPDTHTRRGFTGNHVMDIKGLQFSEHWDASGIARHAFVDMLIWVCGFEEEYSSTPQYVWNVFFLVIWDASVKHHRAKSN